MDGSNRFLTTKHWHWRELVRSIAVALLAAVAMFTTASTAQAQAAGKKPNIPQQNLGAIGSLYNLTMDPFEKYDMIFNGAMSARMPKSSPGQYAGEDNGWILSLVYPVLIEFDQSVIKYPSIKRFPGGASNDLAPNLQHAEDPVPALDVKNPPKVKGGAG